MVVGGGKEDGADESTVVNVDNDGNVGDTASVSFVKGNCCF